MHAIALLTLAFATPSPQKGLDFAIYINSLAHSSIGTPSARAARRSRVKSYKVHKVKLTTLKTFYLYKLNELCATHTSGSL